MEAEEFSVPYGRSNDQIPCWLHPAESQTLVILIHGHNHHGDSRMFRALSEELQSKGVAVCRYSVLREETPKGLLVPTITEEIAQAKTVLEHVRAEYDKIIAVGHSQGGIVALQLGIDGDVDAVVELMSVMDTQFHVERRLESLHLTLDDLRSHKYHSYTTPDGMQMLYTPAFFEDLEIFDVHAMLTEWFGPTLFVAGSKDQRVSEEEVERGFMTANNPKELFTVDDDHLFSVSTAKNVADKIDGWLSAEGLKEDGELH
jgi:esterase/lipase